MLTNNPMKKNREKLTKIRETLTKEINENKSFNFDKKYFICYIRRFCS